MKLFKVKDDKDFIFKLVILITIFSLCFLTIYLFYNLDSIMPMREGMENESDEIDESDKEKEDKESEESETETVETVEPKHEYNVSKMKIMKTVNNALTYENDIRSHTLEKIDFYKNYNKAALIFEILMATKFKRNYSEDLKNRIDVYKFLNSGELENIISNFPLAESVQSTEGESSEKESESSSSMTSSLF